MSSSTRRSARIQSAVDDSRPSDTVGSSRTLAEELRVVVPSTSEVAAASTLGVGHAVSDRPPEVAPVDVPRGQSGRREDLVDSHGALGRRATHGDIEGGDDHPNIAFVTAEVRQTRQVVDTVNNTLLLILRRLDALEERDPVPLSGNPPSQRMTRDGPPHMTAGPSRKGKGNDPTNWANAGIPEHELDIDAQHERYNQLTQNTEIPEEEIETQEQHVRFSENHQVYPTDEFENEDDDEIEEISPGEFYQSNTETLRAHQKRMDRYKELFLLEKARAKALVEKVKANRVSDVPERSNQAMGPPPNPIPRANNRISTTPMSHEFERLINPNVRSSVEPTREQRGTNVILPSNQLPANSLIGQVFQQASQPGDDPFGDDPFGDDDNGGPDPFDLARRRQTVPPTVPMAQPPLIQTRYKQLAPTTPDKYHGDPDAMKYYKFVTQCQRFCQEAGLPAQDQVLKCSDYLAGKAYRFYTTMVSMSLEQWDFNRFMKELFNYCFPPNFRLKQRAKLDNLQQGSMTVTEYAAELVMLYRIIGTSNRTQRVDKLWNGLRRELKTALWKEGLDSQTATWNEVVRVASKHEMADQMEITDRKPSRNENSSRNHSQNQENRRDNNRNDTNRNDSRNANTNNRTYQNGRDNNQRTNQTENRNFRSNERSEAQKSTVPTAPAHIKCFSCGEAGHYDRHCPKKNFVKGKPNSGKPPGAKSFNVEVAMENENKYSELECTTEEADVSAYCMEIEAAVCGFAETDMDSSEEAPAPQEPSLSYEERANAYFSATPPPIQLSFDGKLHDPLSDIVKHQLEVCRPYPGDPDWEDKEWNRFSVYATDPERLVVFDSITCEDEILYIDQ